MKMCSNGGIRAIGKISHVKTGKHSLKVRKTAARWPLFVNKWHFCGSTLTNWDSNKAVVIYFYSIFHSSYFTSNLNKANYMYISSFGFLKCLPCEPNAFVSI